MKKYLVIETFRPGCRDAVYRRVAESGRLLPAGLAYLDSWVEDNGPRCFQLMESPNPELFAEWTRQWEDLVEFEIVPVGDSPAKE